jgi:hypothetical protein
VEAKNGAKKRRAAPRGEAASPAPEPQQGGAAGGCAMKGEAPELRGKQAAACVDGAGGSLREEGGEQPGVGRTAAQKGPRGSRLKLRRTGDSGGAPGGDAGPRGAGEVIEIV